MPKSLPDSAHADSAHEMPHARRVELARERLAALSPGGSIFHPIDVTSAAVIEVRAAATSCLHCRGLYRILEHTRPSPGIRQVDVACRHCSAPRVLWFRIVEREPS